MQNEQNEKTRKRTNDANRIKKQHKARTICENWTSDQRSTASGSIHTGLGSLVGDRTVGLSEQAHGPPIVGYHHCVFPIAVAVNAGTGTASDIIGFVCIFF